MTAQVVDELGQPACWCTAFRCKPGKPTILAVCDGKPVFGLPGNPVSCMVTFDLFVAPTLAHLEPCGPRTPRRTIAARLTAQYRVGDRPRRLRSGAVASGRRRYVSKPCRSLGNRT